MSEKDQQVVNELIELIQKKFTEKYGYCGVMTSENPFFVMLNSGDANIRVEIKVD